MSSAYYYLHTRYEPYDNRYLISYNIILSNELILLIYTLYMSYIPT